MKNIWSTEFGWRYVNYRERNQVLLEDFELTLREALREEDDTSMVSSLVTGMEMVRLNQKRDPGEFSDECERHKWFE